MWAGEGKGVRAAGWVAGRVAIGGCFFLVCVCGGGPGRGLVGKGYGGGGAQAEPCLGTAKLLP